MSSSPDLAGIISLHQQGQLAEARLGYQSLLASQPRHADAWHYLGMLEHQAGNPALATNSLNGNMSTGMEFGAPSLDLAALGLPSMHSS